MRSGVPDPSLRLTEGLGGEGDRTGLRALEGNNVAIYWLYPCLAWRGDHGLLPLDGTLMSKPVTPGSERCQRAGEAVYTPAPPLSMWLPPHLGLPPSLGAPPSMWQKSRFVRRTRPTNKTRFLPQVGESPDEGRGTSWVDEQNGISATGWGESQTRGEPQVGESPKRGPPPYLERSLRARSTSRASSRRLMLSRLSWALLPLHTPSSTFTRPCSLK